MTSAQKSCIALLNTYLGAPLPEAPVDYDAALAYAQTQSMAGIVAGIALSDPRLTAAQRAQYTSIQWATVQRTCNKRYEFSKIAALLESAGIPYMPIKGHIIRAVYPCPDLRTMGDIDIMVHEKDRFRAAQIFFDAGYHEKNTNVCAVEDMYEKACEDGYALGVSVIEVHWKLFSLVEESHPQCRSFISEGLWAYAHPLGDSHEYTLSIEAELMIMVLHTAQNLYTWACGLRYFLDFALYAQYYHDKLDWDMVRGQLAAMGYPDLLGSIYAFVAQYFPVSLPFALPALDDETLSAMAEGILEYGVYGKSQVADGPTMWKYSPDVILSDSRATAANMIGPLARLFFPPVIQLRLRYRYLRRYPFLYPVAWVQNTARRIKKYARKHVFSMMRQLPESINAYSDEAVLRKKIGL